GYSTTKSSPPGDCSGLGPSRYSCHLRLVNGYGEGREVAPTWRSGYRAIRGTCRSRHAGGSGLAEDQIDNPAASDVGSRPSAMGQYVLIRTAALFQGISQDGEVGEPPFIVDGLGDAANRALVRTQPGLFHHDRPKGITKDVTDQVALER